MTYVTFKPGIFGGIPGCVDFASDLGVSKKCVSSMLDIVEVYQWYAGFRDGRS